MAILDVFEAAKVASGGSATAAKQANVLNGLLSNDTGLFLQMLPTKQEGVTVTVRRTTDNGAASWRTINSTTAVSGAPPKFEKFSLSMGALSTHLQVDKILLSGATPAERGVELAMLERIKAQGFAGDLARQIFKSVGATASAVSGIDEQLDLRNSNAIRYTDGSGAAGAAMDTGDLTWLAQYNPDFYVCGSEVFGRITTLGYAETGTILPKALGMTDFGSMIKTLGGKPILVLGDQSNGTEVLAKTETQGTSSGNCGSLYGFKTGIMSDFWMAEKGPIEVEPDRAQIDHPAFRGSYVEYDFTPVVNREFSVCRVAGITV